MKVTSEEWRVVAKLLEEQIDDPHTQVLVRQYSEKLDAALMKVMFEVDRLRRAVDRTLENHSAAISVGNEEAYSRQVEMMEMIHKLERMVLDMTMERFSEAYEVGKNG